MTPPTPSEAAGPIFTTPEFNRLANEARFILRDQIIAAAEASDNGEYAPLFYFYAALAGAGTAIAEVMKAVAETCGAQDPQGLFETLLKQMADAWGQAHGFPAQEAGSVKQ